jgi:beta-galactosidase/beta-glucuronidase
MENQPEQLTKVLYEFKYDISDKIQFGKENILEVKVSKMSADKSVNNAERLADYWILGGIFRPVYLEATPKNIFHGQPLMPKQMELSVQILT